MTKASRCLVLAALAIATTSAAAQQPTGRFYVGAGGGQVHSMDYCGPYFNTVVVACQNTTLAYKVFGGVQLVDFLAVEAGYADLGKFTSELEILGTPVSDETRIRGPLLEAVITLPIASAFSVLGKAGGIYWSLEQDFVVAGVPESHSNSGIDMVLGAGCAVPLQPALRRTRGVRILPQPRQGIRDGRHGPELLLAERAVPLLSASPAG